MVNRICEGIRVGLYLSATSHTLEEIRNYLNADSLHYLSEEGLVRSTGLPKDRFCMACYDGNYPVAFDPNADKLIMERRISGTPTIGDSLNAEKAQFRLI